MKISHQEFETSSGRLRELLKKISTDTFSSCMQCGVCSGSCPLYSFIKTPFNIRKLIYQIQGEKEGFEKEDILYACTTCGLCSIRCPRQIKTIELIRGIRHLIANTCFLPQPYRQVIFSMKTFGNPWSEEREKRILWTTEFNIPLYQEGIEYLLYTCCTNVFDINRKKTLLALSQLFRKAGVSFGIIGKEENCCGESIRKMGEEKEYQTLILKNLHNLEKIGAKKMIAISPHCYYTFKYEYPTLHEKLEIFHYTELLAYLIQKGQLIPKNVLGKRIIYHDPCYLCRHCKVQEEPRNIINSIPGAQLIEFKKNREKSLCCGGGGGNIWMGGNNMKLSNLLIEEALDKKAEILASACPYCLKMLEYSNQIMGNKLSIMDVAEILNEVT